MRKLNLMMRMIIFLSSYLLVYFIPIVAIHFARHMPRLAGNFCLSFPQLMFPFNIMFWKNAPIISNNGVVFFVSGFYIIILSLLFTYATRSVKRKRWIVLFAFCFTILSVVALNCILQVCGITIETRMP